MWTTADPDKFPGQTFLTTSSAALAALKTSGETPFVVGINEQGDLGGLAKFAGASVPGGSTAPGNARTPPLAGAMALFFGGGERHYYRGTLQRVDTAPVIFSVLLNGVRTDVPAVHARGQLKFADRQIMADFYWLDAPEFPLTLKWAISNAGGEAHEIVTKIDQGDAGGTSDQRGAARGHMPDIAGALGGNACHAELHGVYFATGSAELLPPSGPALKALAQVLAINPSWAVTVEGHTDNFGSGDYNLDLSTRRANAVRRALITEYHVAAGRLAAKGYGLTRPVETNATEEGRAHNRRVEISRQCR
jgi:outer membrane protein OmpA-like peptidoglycan-associated protein